MTDERIANLNAIGFVWNIGKHFKPDDELWNKQLKKLKEYRKKHGNCNVPRGYPGNESLAIWVTTQRRQYTLKKEGKKSHLTNKRIKALEAIDFVWSFGYDGLTTDDLWNQRLEELKEYRKKHGNCNVPSVYSANESLGRWVYTQRTQFRLKSEGKKSDITDKRIKELEANGFAWSIRGGKSAADPIATTGVGTNKARKRKSQEVVEEVEQEPCPKEPTELERIKRRRTVKEKLKTWRCKPGSSISDL